VFVSDSSKTHFAPRIVQLGQGNLDFTEAVSGLKEGERVVMLGALALQAQASAAARPHASGTPARSVGSRVRVAARVAPAAPAAAVRAAAVVAAAVAGAD
jgi:hypothetical protein